MNSQKSLPEIMALDAEGSKLLNKGKIHFDDHVQEIDPEDSESDLDESRQLNKFQLLNLVEEGDEIDAGSDIELHHSSESEDECQQSVKAPSQSGKKSSNRKKRNKNKSKNKFHNETLLDGEQIGVDAGTSWQSEVQSNHKTPHAQANKIDNSRLQLLKLDLRNLVPDNEIKRMFGRSVLNESRNKEPQVRLIGVTGPPAKSRFVSSVELELRASIYNAGPNMQLDEHFNESQIVGRAEDEDEHVEKKGRKRNVDKRQSEHASHSDRPTYFRFVHEKAYQFAQYLFMQAAVRGVPEAIMNNLGSHPYHIESIIQMSDVARESENYKVASEWVERALLIFERGFHPKFNLSQPTLRMSYRRPENRTFFITIFKHIYYLNKKGLRRTPLEYSKLLLSLDPVNDPLFAILLIDFYAIRSESYDYLIEFIAQWSHMARLPSLNFSLALAYYMKSRSVKTAHNDAEQLLAKADETLQTSLLRYPNFISPLLRECEGEPDGDLKKCEFFDYSIYTTKYKIVPEPVDLLVNIYVQRTVNLWKQKNVLTWLEKNVSEMVHKFADGRLKDQRQHLNHWSSFNGPSPKNLLRHALLCGLKIEIPKSARDTSVLDIDPYPPHDSLTSYKLDADPRDRLSSSSSNSATGESSRPNATSFPGLFLRSLLPSFSIANDQEREIDALGQAQYDAMYTQTREHLEARLLARDETGSDDMNAEIEALQAALLSLANIVDTASATRNANQSQNQNQTARRGRSGGRGNARRM